jgi:hypothetical protein
MRGEHLAKAFEYERLAKKYTGNPPGVLRGGSAAEGPAAAFDM